MRLTERLDWSMRLTERLDWSMRLTERFDWPSQVVNLFDSGTSTGEEMGSFVRKVWGEPRPSGPC
eukprot:3588049-Pyramimonas_sp.AAC.1